MTDLEKLIEAAEAGTFLRDVLPARNERLAYSAFGGSLDAAQALHEALLPGWRFKIEQSEIVAHGDDFTACVWPNDCSRREQVFRPFGEAPTAARAWLLAILRAYAAEQSA